MSLNLTRRQVLAGASATFALSTLGAPALAQSASYRLGWIAAVTGFGATNAQGQDWGFRMAIQDANEAGGIGGKQFEIIMRDSASEPAKASGFAKELVFNEKVDVLCGPSNSGECLPTLSTVARANKLHFVGGSVEQLIDPVKYPMAFRYLNTSNQWIKAAVKAMAVDMKFKRIAIINDNTPYGPLARDAVIGFMKEHGLEPVYSALVDVNKADLTDELIKARDAGADVVTEWSVSSGFIARLLNARGEQKWNVPVIGHPNILQTQVSSLLSKPEYWDKAYGVGYTHLLVDAQGNLPPKVSALLDKHKDSVGPFLGAGISALLQGHSAATLYLAGLKATDGDADSAKITAALEALSTIEPPLGVFKFSKDNHNGFGDENMLLVAANQQQKNGGYPKVQF
jgi:branched-chain amino acid transport system substrate-binding protein